MRAVLLSAVLFASPVLAQEAPVSTAPPAPQVAPAQAAPAQTAPATPDPVPAAIDPLGDLISQTGTTDEEEPAVNAPAKPHKPTLLPIPAPEPASPTQVAPGVTTDGEHAVPQGNYMPAEKVYEMRVRGSIAAAQGLQGPLDGGWRISGADGAALYTLQIVDPAGGYGPVEGAWRDVRRPGSVGSTGLIDSVERDGSDLVIRFSPRGGPSSVITLRPVGETRWSGGLAEAGVNAMVTAEREAPPNLPPGYVVASRGPVIWGAPRAAPRPAAPAKPVACSTRGKTGKALKAAKAKCAAAAKKSGGSKASAKKGSKAKATASRKGKATAVKKKSTAKKKPNLR